MLPQQRLSARRRIEEVRADRLVEQQQDRRARQDRDGQQQQARGDEQCPDAQSGSRNQFIPGARMLITVVM